jgi:hypothetical protein
MDHMSDYASENDEDVNYRRPKSPIKISSYVNYEEEEDCTSGAFSATTGSETDSLTASSTSSSSTSLTRPTLEKTKVATSDKNYFLIFSKKNKSSCPGGRGHEKSRY